MNDKTFIAIAKLYGYNIEDNIIEGMVFEKEELIIHSKDVQFPIPNLVFTLTAEVDVSNDIFSIYMDNDKRNISSIFAVQFIDTTKNKSTLLDLSELEFYDPLSVPKEELIWNTLSIITDI